MKKINCIWQLTTLKVFSLWCYCKCFGRKTQLNVSLYLTLCICQSSVREAWLLSMKGIRNSEEEWDIAKMGEEAGKWSRMANWRKEGSLAHSPGKPVQANKSTFSKSKESCLSSCWSGVTNAELMLRSLNLLLLCVLLLRLLSRTSNMSLGSLLASRRERHR